MLMALVAPASSNLVRTTRAEIPAVHGRCAPSLALARGYSMRRAIPARFPTGSFSSWLGQVQRVQRLSNDQLLIIRADVQLTPDSLLPSEQFVIGGVQSVRGFRQNARSGDNGIRFSIEDRITLLRNEGGAPLIQIAPFLDLGMVWNAAGNPNQLPDQRFLAGAGLGFLWDGFMGIEGLSARFDYSFPFVDLSDRGENAQDLGFYFNLNYQLKELGKSAK